MKNIVHLVYKYINEFIDENELIEKVDELISKEKNPKSKESLEILKEKVKEQMNLHEVGTCILYDKIYTLLTTDDYYLQTAKSMSSKDLMLMITEYLYANFVPSISQEVFDELVDAAIEDNNTAKENSWRLAHNYVHKGFNFEKIIDYLISTRDVWYVMELFHSIGEVLNLDEMIEKIIATKDSTFIEGILNDNFLDTIFTKEQIDKLKKQF